MADRVSENFAKNRALLEGEAKKKLILAEINVSGEIIARCDGYGLARVALIEKVKGRFCVRNVADLQEATVLLKPLLGGADVAEIDELLMRDRAGDITEWQIRNIRGS